MKTTIYKGPDRELDTIEICDLESRLWLARMCVGEGGNKCTVEHASAMLTALTNRYLLHPWRHAWREGFIAFVRAFSQPINPRWQAGGDLAIKHKSSKTVLARRKKICSLTIRGINPSIVSLVDDFITGDWGLFALLDDCQISNWSTSTIKSRKANPNGMDIDGNWFFEDKGLKGYVTVSAKKLSEYSRRELLEELLRREREEE